MGVIVFYLLTRLFSDYGTWYLVGLGLLAILATMYFPGGIWGYAARRFGVVLFSVQLRLTGPSGPPQEYREHD